jgi:FKBP-type peptidyl-prolyl cis-trans isomerase
LEKNTKAGETFLADNKKKPGVRTHPVTMPDGTTAELQYKVLSEGSGALPGSNEVVKVNYRGTLINGTEFDSSAKHGGQPLTFALNGNGVIRGMIEGVKLMKIGSKWEIYIPTALAYRDRPMGPIEPGSTLIFEVELLGAEAPQPPPPSATQPLTSDIIRVPSAEEMKAGQQVERIDPKKLEELQRQAATQAKTNKP